MTFETDSKASKASLVLSHWGDGEVFGACGWRLRINVNRMGNAAAA
jgi:hypothetical protein